MSSHPLVIVPVDGSPETERTLQFAACLVAGRAADLHVVQVVDRDRGAWRAAESEARLRARLKDLPLPAACEGTGLRVVTLRGRPERVIPAYAQLNAASLIVVGRGYGTSRFWRAGMVASRLSRSSPVPVVVVPRTPLARTAGRPSFTHIVAAVDFTVASAIALQEAAALARRHGARLTLFHAMDIPRQMVLSGGEAWHLAERVPDESDAIADHLHKKAAALGVRDVRAVVIAGEPGRGIVETAAEGAADLVVLGVAPRSRFAEALFGSTLRAILRRAETPVLVLPIMAGGHEWVESIGGEAVPGVPAGAALAHAVA